MTGPATQAEPSTGTLRTQVLLYTGLSALAFFLLLYGAVDTYVSQALARQARAALIGTARHAATAVDGLLASRQRELRLLGNAPAIVDAARAGAASAARLGIVGRPTADLERQFDERRTLDIDPRVREFFRARITGLDAAEIMLTDVNGYNVVTTQRTSDFVQSDEAWWQRAMADGAAPATATFDESVGAVVLSMTTAVRDASGDRPVGVLKVGTSIAPLAALLDAAPLAQRVDIAVVDATGRVIAGTRRVTPLSQFPGVDALDSVAGSPIIEYGPKGGEERASVRPANGGTWRVIAYVRADAGAADLVAVRRPLQYAMVAIFLALAAALTALNEIVLKRRIGIPVARLAAAAEGVAAGDLGAQIPDARSNDEIGRLSRATRAMLEELRALAGALRTSSHETAALASQITGGAEHMAASAEEMASTSSVLSDQSTSMAQTIQEMVGDATRLVSISSALSEGAHEGVNRNRLLRELTSENRIRFDAAATSLTELAADVRQNAVAMDTLARASEEIRNFVTLVQKMARQSKLLALNASMEAARAGEQGQGFAVVASEVRRLAANSQEAAERTEALVGGVLKRVELSRQASARMVDTVRQVFDATHQGIESFGAVEREVRGAETWTTSIEASASQSSTLVGEMTARLDGLAQGTESFAAAMEQVAAASEQQSASTEEIAAAAHSLATAADRLAALVATFRLESNTGSSTQARLSDSTTAPFRHTGAVAVGDAA